MILQWDGDPVEFAKGDVLWYATVRNWTLVELSENWGSCDIWTAHVHTNSDLDLYGAGDTAQEALDELHAKALEAMVELMGLLGYEKF